MDEVNYPKPSALPAQGSPRGSLSEDNPQAEEDDLAGLEDDIPTITLDSPGTQNQVFWSAATNVAWAYERDQEDDSDSIKPPELSDSSSVSHDSEDSEVVSDRFELSAVKKELSSSETPASMAPEAGASPSASRPEEDAGKKAEVEFRPSSAASLHRSQEGLGKTSSSSASYVLEPRFYAAPCQRTRPQFASRLPSLAQRSSSLKSTPEQSRHVPVLVKLGSYSTTRQSESSSNLRLPTSIGCDRAARDPEETGRSSIAGAASSGLIADHAKYSAKFRLPASLTSGRKKRQGESSEQFRFAGSMDSTPTSVQTKMKGKFQVPTSMRPNVTMRQPDLKSQHRVSSKMDSDLSLRQGEFSGQLPSLVTHTSSVSSRLTKSHTRTLNASDSTVPKMSCSQSTALSSGSNDTEPNPSKHTASVATRGPTHWKKAAGFAKYSSNLGDHGLKPMEGNTCPDLAGLGTARTPAGHPVCSVSPLGHQNGPTKKGFCIGEQMPNLSKKVLSEIKEEHEGAANSRPTDLAPNRIGRAVRTDADLSTAPASLVPLATEHHANSRLSLEAEGNAVPFPKAQSTLPSLQPLLASSRNVPEDKLMQLDAKEFPRFRRQVGRAYIVQKPSFDRPSSPRPCLALRTLGSPAQLSGNFEKRLPNPRGEDVHRALGIVRPQPRVVARLALPRVRSSGAESRPTTPDRERPDHSATEEATSGGGKG